MIIDNRMFLPEDDEILVTALVKCRKASAESRETWEKKVRRENVTEDIERIIRRAFEIAFGNEDKAFQRWVFHEGFSRKASRRLAFEDFFLDF